MTVVSESLEQSSRQGRLFFVLSGEHPTLPAAEVLAVIESVGVRYTHPQQSYRLLTLEAPTNVLKDVAQRSLMYDWSGIELGRCRAKRQEIYGLIRNLHFENLVRGRATFAVRSLRLGGVNKSIRRVNLERDTGSLLQQQAPSFQVNLREPEVTFLGLLFDDHFLFGVSAYAKPSGLIAPRRPRRRPVFHPSTMPPKIARCMVNLSRAKRGAIFCDPFSGVGGILIEASVIGCNVVGADVNLRMLRGAHRNISHFGLDTIGLVCSDARRLSFTGLDAIATDPPYGRGSSTMGGKVADIVKSFLGEVKSALVKKGHLCISAPADVQVEAYGQQAGLTVREKHLVRVHRSLTRQIMVLQST